MKNNISGVDCQPVAMGVIYLITCRINGKPYVGQTRQKLERRISQHKSGKGKSAVDIAIAKYGWENFSVAVLEVCPVAMLNEREKFWIAALNSKAPHGYNLTDGGGGNSNPSKETRAKISANHADVSGKNNPNYGKKCSSETRRKISEARKGQPSPRKGKKHSLETRKKISEARKGQPSPRKGKKHSEESKAKMSAIKKGKKGKPHSLETRAQISASNKGKPSRQKGKQRTEETKAKISVALKVAWARRKKAVENGDK